MLYLSGTVPLDGWMWLKDKLNCPLLLVIHGLALKTFL